MIKQSKRQEEKTDKGGRPRQRIIALAGNPNVGKSTLFNQLTGLRQHTGNWAGKTVATAKGVAEHNGKSYLFVDLPGTYSLFARSGEEEVARDFICFGEADAVLVVCDATCLTRNLHLVLQTLEITSRVVVCVNLLDEAKRKHIKLNLEALCKQLGVPVVGCTAKNKKSLYPLFKALDQVIESPPKEVFCPQYPQKIEDAIAKIEPHLPSDYCHLPARWLALRLLEEDRDLLHLAEYHGGGRGLKTHSLIKRIQEAKAHLEEKDIADGIPRALVEAASEIAKLVIEDIGNREFDRQIDKLLTGKKTAFPLMLFFFLLIFWITIWGANYISDFLSRCFLVVEAELLHQLNSLSPPSWLVGILIEGIYRVLSWVVSVMLPPMLIFFPLFTLLEDVGYLPRIAFNLDKPCALAGSCGKQALTMCMGFGCNAVGVMGCRIIDSKREAALAMLTNCFVPCNGRFPFLMLLLTVFFVGNGGNLLAAVLLLLVVMFGVLMTFLATKLLSITFFRGLPSSFTLELPPFRKPKVLQVMVRSMLDRILITLGRAVAVAIPAGGVIWLLANLEIGNISLLRWIADGLHPIGRILGMDGMILLAFFLALPASEIVLPILLMGYLAEGSLVNLEQADRVGQILIAQGWTAKTAICTILFSLFHFPCSTTLLTVKKETGSWKMMLFAFLLPTLCGVICCSLVNLLFSIF